MTPCLDLSTLPTAPGVYYFYRDETLLYIGKSIDIRKRVRSHYYDARSGKNNKEQRLMKSTNHIKFTQTIGELSALILESKEIKSKRPMYNRRLRKRKSLLAWELALNENTAVSLVEHKWPPHNEQQQYGLFRSRWHATDMLKKLCSKHQLCEKRLGLANSQGPCFNYQIKKCLGACVGKESLQQHDARLLTAFSSLNNLIWPYPGAIAIKEMASSCNYSTFDRWRFLGEARSLQEAALLVSTPVESNFDLDLDSYRIVISYINKHKNTELIQPIQRLMKD